MVYNLHLEQWETPNIWERERLMGFEDGDTAAPDITISARCQLIGRTMDKNMSVWLGGILMASHNSPSYIDTLPMSVPSHPR